MALAGAAIVGLGLGLLTAGGIAWWRRRRWRADLVETLGHQGDEPPPGLGFRSLVGRVERVLDARRGELLERDAEADRLRAALDEFDEAVWVYDDTGEVVVANAAGRAYEEARHGEALISAGVEEAVGDALAGRPAERSVDLAGPPSRTVAVRATPLGAPTDPTGAVAIATDISERLRLDAVRRDFVANVSHELKTPIGGLALLAEIAAGTDDDAERARLVERLQCEALRASQLVDDLLELDGIERDPGRVQVSVDPDEVVDEARRRVEATSGGYGVAIEVRRSAAVRLVGDPAQLAAAVANLLDNAVKYSPEGSTVVTTTDERDGWLEIAVVDRGVGIPPDELERVFERFYRVDQARSRRTGGTGLGLSIVRNVARAHGGDVEVTSREGEGSTFTLRLPVERALPAPEPR